MSIGTPYLAGAIVFGVALLMAPRLAGRTAAALRISGRLRRDRRLREVDLDRASAYHRYVTGDDCSQALDERTWQDLDLDAVFVSLDHTASEPGRQALYHRLRTPAMEGASLLHLESVVREVAPHSEQVEGALGKLDDPRAGALVELFYGELPSRPRLWWCFPILTISSFALLVLFISGLWPAAALVWVGLCLVNILLQLTYRPRVKRFVPALHQLPRFLDAAATLSELPIRELAPERQCLRDGARRLRALRRATWWLQFEPGQSSELASTVYEYVNLAFLLDVNAFVLAVDMLRTHRTELRAMFEAIGYIDSARSIGLWREDLAQWARPDFTDHPRTLAVEGLVHPLVSDAVANTLSLESTNVLLTGSNMSGKSTFVRAIGLGAVLGQTLHTVCAARWCGPRMCVRSAIGRGDSVIEGKSYYLAEAESVLELVRASESTVPHLFLLDEIFRGTNTTERVAAGAAVLAYLSRGPHLTFVATHDLELLELLGDRYAAYHFREHVNAGAMEFDFTLYAGPSSTRNAIALLDVLRYPPALIADARAASERGNHPARQEPC